MAAQLFADLKKRSKVDLSNKTPKNIISRLPQIFEEAMRNKKLEKYDQAYIFCQRYLYCIEWLQKIKPKDKKYDPEFNITKISEADIDLMKQEHRFLNDKLSARYSQKINVLSDSVEKMQMDDVLSLLPDTPTDEPLSMELEEITCQHLFNLLKRNEKRLLIIDVRSVKEFKKNTINMSRCINIPPEEIQNGKTASSIERYLILRDPKMCKLYQERDKSHTDTIVIIDENSNNAANASRMFDIFKSWDLGKKFGQIAVLKGGFNEWAHLYPIHRTNTNENTPLSNNDKNVIIDMLDNVDYENLLEDEARQYNLSSVSNNKIEDKRKIMPNTNKSIIKLGEERRKVIADNNKTTIKLEEELKVNDNNRTPLVDRSNKPGNITDESNRILVVKQKFLELLKQLYIYTEDIFQREKLLLKREHNLDILKVDKKLLEYQEMAEFLNSDKHLHQKKIEELKASCLLSGDSLRKSNCLDVNIGDILAKIRNIEVARKNYLQQYSQGIHKEPLKMDNFYGNSGLKRSHSSPNLAQVKKFKANQTSEPKIPQVDRSSKPQINHRNQNVDIPQYSRMSVSERENRMEPVSRTHCYPGITGLKNLGNSCYMNSIIQCLSNTATLAKYFNENAYYDDLNDRIKNGVQGQVAEEVAQVIKALWRGHYKSIVPRDLKNVIGQYKLQFESHDQQDSHEFLTFLLDWMHNDLKKESPRKAIRLTNAEKEWNNATSNQSSVISKLFFGQLRSTVCCSICENNSITYEIFNSLTMSLSSSSKCTLDDCIKQYVSGQKISEWKCPYCKVPRDAIKKFDFVKLSPIIVIHLNRFGESDGWLEKKNTVVDFPLTDFNLEQYIARDEMSNNKHRQYNYNLYAMSNHSGTMEGGHYTAYCKNAAQDKWYKYDDHTVAEVPKWQVKSQTTSAYLLFYSSLPDRDVPIHKIDT